MKLINGWKDTVLNIKSSDEVFNYYEMKERGDIELRTDVTRSSFNVFTYDNLYTMVKLPLHRIVVIPFGFNFRDCDFHYNHSGLYKMKDAFRMYREVTRYLPSFRIPNTEDERLLKTYFSGLNTTPLYTDDIIESDFNYVVAFVSYTEYFNLFN